MKSIIRYLTRWAWANEIEMLDFVERENARLLDIACSLKMELKEYKDLIRRESMHRYIDKVRRLDSKNYDS